MRTYTAKIIASYKGESPRCVQCEEGFADPRQAESWGVTQVNTTLSADYTNTRVVVLPVVQLSDPGASLDQRLDSFQGQLNFFSVELAKWSAGLEETEAALSRLRLRV